MLFTCYSLVHSLLTRKKFSIFFSSKKLRSQKIVFSILYQLAPDWHDLADLAQEVFIRVYRHIGSLRNPKTFKAWLNQITINLSQ